MSGDRQQIRELTREEFLATMKAPMTIQPVDAPALGVKIGRYVKACLARIDPGLTRPGPRARRGPRAGRCR